ncbi:MAG TPA: DUF1571 domain-containing protein [Planctomycetaceae bacterium]|nr:DUF1571 domain-containing protein [Planctomycetaceae bacterium]
MNRFARHPNPAPRRVKPGLGPAWLFALAIGLLWGEAGLAEDAPLASRRRPSRSKPAVAPEAADVGKPDNRKEKELPALTLQDVMKFAEPSLAAQREIKDYTAVFTKKELIKGRMLTQVMDMKFRTKPFSVYFKYRSGAEAGRQAIYVEGKNANNLVVKEVGLKAIAGTMHLRLDNPLVTAENHYPVTTVGIANMLNEAMAAWVHESKMEGTDIDVKFFPNAKLGEVPCQAFQVTHKIHQRDLKFHIGRVYFDKETKLLVRAERFGWPRHAGEKAPLVEDYIYSNVKTNVGLTDADFDPARYGF